MMTSSGGRVPADGRASRRPGTPYRAARAAVAVCAAALAGVLALAACGGASTMSTAAGAPAPAHKAALGMRNAAAGSGATYGQLRQRLPATTLSVPLPGQDIIYTASLTERVKNLQAEVAAATGIAAAAGGYTASEQMSAMPGTSVISAASLQLEIPVAGYQAQFAKLARLGRVTSQNQQAQNVTQQVADVASRVTSARTAITQLRALLAHAGSVGSLLSVQDQINAEETALESLLAQQRALAHQTSYATVSVLLTERLHHAAAPHKSRRHGFAAGLAAGWHALRAVTSAVLAALGASLPFAVVVAVLAGLALPAARWLRRRRARPAADA